MRYMFSNEAQEKSYITTSLEGVIACASPTRFQEMLYPPALHTCVHSKRCDSKRLRVKTRVLIANAVTAGDETGWDRLTSSVTGCAGIRGHLFLDNETKLACLPTRAGRENQSLYHKIIHPI